LPLSATRATSQQARPQRSSKLIILSHAGDVLHSPHPMQRGLSPQSSSSPKNGTAGPQLPRRDLHRTDGLFSVRSRCPGTPDVDAGKKEQPHDVDEVPVPCGCLEAEVLLGREVALQRPQQTDEE